MPTSVKWFGALAAGAVLALGQGAAAQGYPVKPVRLIVPFAPGGAADIIGRMVAAQLAERLGEQIVVENRPGAGGAVGAEVALRAKPDGYTLLLFSSAHAINPALHKLPYDPLRDLAPLGRAATAVSALVVHPSVPATSVRELVALARRNPGKLDFGSAGVGSFTHLAIQLFRMLAGIDIVIVDYKGAGPAVIDLLGGHTQASISTLSAFMPHLRSGRLRLLAVGARERSPLLPQAPTIAEAGVPGFEASPWFGFALPAGTPPAIVARLAKELEVALAREPLRSRLLDQGAHPDFLGPAEFASFYAAEMAKWAKVVKAAKVEPR